MKTCRSCSVDKDDSCFHPYPRNLDGLQSYCKECQTLKRREKYSANPAPYRAEALRRHAERTVTEAQKLEKSQYDRDYRRKNASHLDDIKAKWRKQNAPLIRVVRTTYKAKRRAKVKQGDSSKVVLQWLQGQAKVCRWCGCDCADSFHIDHIKPLAKGGEHRVSNLCVSCPTCNIRKNAKLPEEWERHRVDVGMVQ
jgi:hypothetical protein